MALQRPHPVGERVIQLRWLAAGVLFGAMFPLLGWLMAMSADGVSGVQAAHEAQPVLYIVDLAPLVLGLTGLDIGMFHSRLVRIRHSIELTVTERTADLQRALNDLSTAQAEFLSAQKLEAIGGLAAGIAHEINTPIQYVGDNTKFVEESLHSLLSVVSASARLAAASEAHDVSGLIEAYESAARDAEIDYLATEVPNAIKESLDGIEQVAAIVRALKSFAHPGTDRKSPSDLNEMITDTVAVARGEWKTAAEMDLNGLDPELPLVPVLAGPLKQVLLNMVINAAHAIEDAFAASGGKGQITIATAAAGGFAEIAIADNGGGIPPEIRDRIFEPFFTTKTVGKGSGQGLAIAQSIIGNHDGTLTFETEVGTSTVFKIRLPIEVAAEAAAEREGQLAS
jgi:C4-dicarboxylate-specific signal transduction histidine kinase